MTSEMLAIFGNSVLTVILIMAQQIYNDLFKGPEWAVSARDDQSTNKVAARIKRALFNQIENTAVVIPILLTVILLEAENDLTRVCSTGFLICRALYLPLYAFGVPHARSMVWGLSMMMYMAIIIRIMVIVEHGWLGPVALIAFIISVGTAAFFGFGVQEWFGEGKRARLAARDAKLGHVQPSSASVSESTPSSRSY